MEKISENLNNPLEKSPTRSAGFNNYDGWEDVLGENKSENDNRVVKDFSDQEKSGQGEVSDNSDQAETQEIIGGALDNGNAVVTAPESTDQISKKLEKKDAGVDVKDRSETKAETYEERMEKRKEKIKNRAEEIYQERVVNKISKESIIEILKENRINEDPESYDAKKFLENWDWSRAEEDVNKEYRVKISWSDKEGGGGKSGDKPKEKTKEGSGDENGEAINNKKNESDDGKTEKTIKADKAEKKSGEQISEKAKKQVELARDEKYGIDRSSTARKAAKGFFGAAVKSVSSVLGVRAAYEVPKLAYDYFKKKGQKNELSEVTIDILEEARKAPKLRVDPEHLNSLIEVESKKIEDEHKNDSKLQAQGDEILEKEKIEKWTDQSKERMQTWYKKLARERVLAREKEKIGQSGSYEQDKKDKSGSVRVKIDELEKKLKTIKMAPEEKQALRNELSSVLWEYRSRAKNQENIKSKRLGSLLVEHINNKEQRWLAAKEFFNTLSIGTAMPFLRVAGYAGFSALEKWRKTEKQAIEKIMKAEKITRSQAAERVNSQKSEILKGSFKNALSETFHGLTFSHYSGKTEEKSKFQKGTEFAAALGSMLRLSVLGAGLYEYESAMGSGLHPAMSEGAQKWLEAVKYRHFGDAAGQMKENWLGNINRIAGHFKLDWMKKESVAPTGVMSGKGVEELGKHITEQYQKDYQNVTNVFGADSEISGKLLSGGLLDQQKIHLVETLKNIGLAPDDFKNFHGDGGQLSQLLDKVDKLGSEHQVDIMRALIDNPGNTSKLDDPIVQSILKSKFGGEHIKDILSAKHVATIDKSGGSISEALGRAIGHNDKVTVINPDGKILHNFDANLVHKGDVVSLNDKGEITVFKTSDVSVKAGQSLEGVYAGIADEVNKADVPKEIQDRFNEGVGHWGEKITRGESEKMLHFWNNHKTAYGHLTPEKQQEFLHNLHSAKSDAEVDKMLNEISNAPAHSVAEAVVLHPAENVVPVEGYHDVKELKSDGAPDVSSWPLANQQHSKSDDKIFEFSANRTTVDRITTIFGEKKEQFSAPADLDKISAWKEVKGKLASDVLSDKFNKPSGWFGWLSGRKTRVQYGDLQKYLIGLNKDHKIQINEKETVADYIKRAEEWLSKERVYK